MRLTRIAVIALLIFAMLSTVSCDLSSNSDSNSATNTSNAEDYAILVVPQEYNCVRQWGISATGISYDCSISGIVRNKGKKDYDIVNVCFDWIDSRGIKVGTSCTTIVNLRVGQTMEFSVQVTHLDEVPSRYEMYVEKY